MHITHVKKEKTEVKYDDFVNFRFIISIALYNFSVYYVLFDCCEES